METVTVETPEPPRKPSKAVATRQSAKNLAAVDTSPEGVLRLAISQGAPLEQLEKFMALRERHEANEAKKAFNVALAAFKAEAVTITKATEYTDGPLKGRSYANLSDIVTAVTPALSKHGLSISWKLTKDDPQWMEVTCTLRHADGHSESVSMGAAPDAGPGRNAIQARGSAKTYLEKYTATGILGLAASDQDDDGGGGKKGDGEKNGATAGEKQPYTDEQFQKNLPQWRELVKGKKTTPEAILAKLDSTFLLLDSQRKAIRELANAHA